MQNQSLRFKRSAIFLILLIFGIIAIDGCNQTYFSFFFLIGFCKRERMEADIDDAVSRLSKIAILAACNLHYRVYKAIIFRDDDDYQWLEDFFNGQKPNLRPFYDEVKSTRSLNPPRSDFSDFLENRFGIECVNASNLRNILRYEQASYLTCFHNVLTENAQSYVRRLFRLYFLRLNAQANGVVTAAEKRQQTIYIDHTLRFLFNPRSIVQSHDGLLTILDDITEYELILTRGGLSAATNRNGYLFLLFLSTKLSYSHIPNYIFQCIVFISTDMVVFDSSFHL